MLSENMSETGWGRRTLFKELTCLDQDNILGDIKAETNTQNFDMIRVQGNCVCFEPNCKTYIKWFNVEPYTTYFMNFSGRTDPDVLTDLQFGIVDCEGLKFKNHHTKREKSFYVFNYGLDQELTISGQDGELYNRCYCFYTGKNSAVGFFAEGTVGKVYFEDLKVFKAINALVPAEKTKSVCINYSEDIINCLEINNIISGLKCFFENKNFSSFFKKADNGIIYDKNDAGGYYFYAYIPLEPRNVYTVVYKQNIIRKGNFAWGIIAEDKNGKRRWLTNGDTNAVGKEKVVADVFGIAPDEKIAFAFYDGGGAVEFYDFKVFNFGNGIDEK